MENTRIVVDSAAFSVGDEYQWLAQSDADGAVVTFTGKVRNHNLGDNVSALTLEHYPGMTEKALAEIVAEARQRWPLQRVSVYHRVGAMYPGDEIVFVGVTSAHRGMAFEATEFIMDYLKTRAPFWKREATEQGDRWVDAATATNKPPSAGKLQLNLTLSNRAKRRFCDTVIQQAGCVYGLNFVLHARGNHHGSISTQ
ncbi:Molybdopterin synthase catalytic subunit [Ewingella americana]|uniref:Molybdopterin synthase catalytic subunit n=1 Tax=Ewingella americana TaxID=41202 RepID=A0A377NFS0_9GAMM|nr:Molybdopterin synthase catalytic subunit [Ewingella americana]